ncbi:hypothetical protein HK101_012017 [Irineochytrium annulatum]|nr:hypothetical protein HK101_012017 [Irineochytrium annulatum]
MKTAQPYQPHVMTPEQQRERSRKISWGVRRMVLLNIIGPIVVYYVANIWIANITVCLLLSGIPPFIDGVLTIVQARKVDILSSTVIGSIILSVILTLLTNDARLLFVKDSFLTALLGLMFLGSVCCGRENLIWMYNRQFNPPEAQEELTEQFKNPHVKRHTNLMCYVWGTGLLLEAILRVVFVFTIPITYMAWVSPVLVAVACASLGIWSFLYTRSVQKKYKEVATREPVEV